MDLRGRPAEQVDHLVDVVGLGEVAPVQVDLVGRDLGDDVPDPVDLGVPEQRVGVHLQRPLADHRAVPLVLEVGLDLGGVDEAAHGGHVGLLHREHHVVVERLGVALDQQVVRREAGAADAEAGLAGDVAQVVEQLAVEALVLGDRLQVGLEGPDDLGPLGLAEAAHRGVLAQHPDPVDEDRGLVEEVGPPLQPGGRQGRVDRPVGVVEVQREVVVVLARDGTRRPGAR